MTNIASIEKKTARGQQVKRAELVEVFDLEDFGGPLHVVDLDGDGRFEYLVRQNAGHLRSKAHKTPKAGVGISREELEINCLTALDGRGRKLWQAGSPHRGEHPFASHGGDDLTVCRLDGGVTPQVVAVEMDMLRVYDSADGTVRREKQLPGDNFCAMAHGAVKGDPSRNQLLVKVTDSAYEPYRYGNPSLLLDSDLTELWMRPHFHGSGHLPVMLDIDGDGFDEILIGYNLVDHDGELLWTIPVENADQDHADHIIAGDFNADGRIEIVYAGSKDYFMADVAGNILWQRPHEHSQKSLAGRFRTDVAGQTIILNEKFIGMTAYTPEGQPLWNRPGTGYAQHALKGWTGDERELILFEPQLKRPAEEAPFHSEPEKSHDFWPLIFDGEGRIAAELPWRDEYAQPRQLVRGGRAYDFGIGYATQVADLDDDGRDEIVVSDRRRVWIFSAG